MRKMHKITVCCLLLSLLLSVHAGAAQVNNDMVYPVMTNEIPGWPAGVETASETAIVMDADTGAILYNKGMDELRYPASITKIMTALLTLEHCDLEEQVVFTEECLADQASDSSNAGIQVGEILTVRQCLYLLMLKSANDVATQLGVHIAGSVEAFADMMNARAQELGCVNTHFVNASGMPDENHYTTAHDMALIFRQAIKNETFLEVIGTASYNLDATNMSSEIRNFGNHHPMIIQDSGMYYEGCLGGKTGGTTISKNTLVTGATRDGMTLIVVSMRTDFVSVVGDHIALLDYGFQNFKHEEVPGGIVTIPVDSSIEELTKQEEQDGDVINETYYYQTAMVGSGIRQEEPEVLQEDSESLAAETEGIQNEENLRQEMTLELSDPAQEETASENEMSSILRYVIYGLGVVNVLAIILIFVGLIRKKKK